LPCGKNPKIFILTRITKLSQEMISRILPADGSESVLILNFNLKTFNSMKNIIKFVSVAGLLALASCETNLDTINENPNDKASIDPKFLLTYVFKALFR
jgi:hypothetical protein